MGREHPFTVPGDRLLTKGEDQGGDGRAHHLPHHVHASFHHGRGHILVISIKGSEGGVKGRGEGGAR